MAYDKSNGFVVVVVVISSVVYVYVLSDVK